jgi:hypothetical protein
MWLSLTDDEMNRVGRALRQHGEAEDITLAERLRTDAIPGRNDAAYRSAAADPFGEDYEIEDDAPVSVSDDGAYVMAWVYVTDGEADLCSECRASLEDGEGYDGMCGDCADQHESEEEDD